MLGESRRLNVHAPPWNTTYDETSENNMYPSSPTNVSTSPYFFQEALTALQRYLPSNESELDSDPDFDSDSALDAYSCDQFRMFEFKIRRCTRGRSHDWTECPFAHPGEKARRRDPRKFHYSGTACPEFRKGNCKKGDACDYAHGVFECWLHPSRYRTQPCKDGPNCRRRVCFFAHTPGQLRVVNDNFDHKTLPFLSSPVSVSPPESPPMSPMLSHSVGSVGELVASFRNMQLQKLKSLPPSWMNSPVSGSGSGYLSPRSGSMLRPGVSSLPTTPTRVVNQGGLGYWDKVSEEEPLMERVESGRDLRVRMFEKLSKENSVGRVDPDSDLGGSSAPDVGWVSELVK